MEENIFHQIVLKVSPMNVVDFQSFLSGHQNVILSQKANGCLFIDLTYQNQQECSAFLQGIKEIFEIENLKEIKICLAKYRDGTNCLNKAKYGDYCWKHKIICDIKKIKLGSFHI